MIHKWKLLKEEDISPSKWMQVSRHTVQLPNGTIVDDYFTSRLGQVAMILPITIDNEIVFAKQYKHGTGEIFLELPAGVQQSGKTVEESALAELEEETGIKTTASNLTPLGKMANNPSKLHHITFGFLARNLTFNSTQKLDATEDIELVKITPKKTLEMVSSGEIWVADTVAIIMKTYLMFPGIFK